MKKGRKQIKNLTEKDINIICVGNPSCRSCPLIIKKFIYGDVEDITCLKDYLRISSKEVNLSSEEVNVKIIL